MKKIFTYTLPVIVVYISLGMAYGILMAQNGYGPIWSFFSSLLIFAGAAQYALVTLLVAAVNPISAFFLILIINARHIFYGISMLNKFEDTGKAKWYLMFGLTDETFGFLSSVNVNSLHNKKQFFLGVTLLNHFYWVLGSTLGGIIGTVVGIQIQGLEFILVALFVGVFISQIMKQELRLPGLLGLLISFAMLIIFRDHFIIPSMVAIIVVMALLDRYKVVRNHE
ncbi:MAG: AzlC family ABC transporter permease [Candidatus Izimaplasma sp.]|nr:AzlC family ABC transporter permease [Candidatus Izimaplasma bacterium]